MTATDELRRLLSEAGVEYKVPASYDGSTKYDTIVDDYWFHEYDGRITVHGLTPEQAIEATLGRGTCRKVRVHEVIEDEMHCSECGRFLGFAGDIGAPPYNYCPNCGAKVVDE